MKTFKNIFAYSTLSVFALIASACGDLAVSGRSPQAPIGSGNSNGENGGGTPLPNEEDGVLVSQFGKESSRKLTVIGSSQDGLANPRDLEFNPKKPNELWTVNKDIEGVVIFHNAGTPKQRSEKLVDTYAKHFMSKVSSIAFGPDGNFATCHESRNEARGIIDFMGPTLWTSDLSIFAKVNQKEIDGAECDGTEGSGILQGSHLDMLHQSPLCMGIAHVNANQYWTFDGANGDLVFYDFAVPHEPGGDDHSDGRLRRHADVRLSRVVGVPSHMIVDPSSDMLYIADTGTGSILKIDTSIAKPGNNISPDREPLASYKKYSGSQVSTFAQGLRQPSGIVIADKKLFVSDFATGEIIAYNLVSGKEMERIATGAKKIMGLAVSPSNHLWYVDGGANTVVRIDP